MTLRSFSLTQGLTAVTLIVILPALFFWWGVPWLPEDLPLSLSAALGCLLASALTLRNFERYPGMASLGYIIPVVIFWSALIVVAIKISGARYSFHYLATVAALLVVGGFLRALSWWSNGRRLPLAYIPLGRSENMPEQLPTVLWHRIASPQCALPENISGIVADLHSPALDEHWLRFIADACLAGKAVYHYRDIRESLSGRVRLEHMQENELGSLLPSPNYLFLKWVVDALLIVCTLPFWLPIALVVALLIRFIDGAPIFYWQRRVGWRGKIIAILKFRTMKDETITPLGRWIRRLRLDEIPQFFNVLKGEMSLIGPRPETEALTLAYAQEIPYFNYRQIVRPGISGWSQVNLGYTSDADGARAKIEYDFFYIKHLSFSLDLLIFFKTLQTIITGFGAR